ncbi:MAG: type II secretion system F family protein [Halobacteriales archaeon]|nr:type II secretion system F family protein [Halobacteriales archaeon]
MSVGAGEFGNTSDILADSGYPLYRRLFDPDGDFVSNLETKLAQARMSAPVEIYVSRSLAIGALIGIAFWILGLLLGTILFVMGLVPVGTLVGLPVSDPAVAELINAIKIPVLVFTTGLVFGAIGFGIGFGTLIVIPYSRASARKREINMLLPDAVSFMYALSVGGLNQLEIIESIARADDTYGEVAREFQSIVQETEYFDTDYRTAIRQQALESPSEELSQFLTDMLSIINSGGDMESFLDDKKDKHMRTAKQQQELTLETLELFGEMYMTLSLFPLLLIIVLVIMGMLGNSTEQMLLGTVYGLIPLTGVGFLVLVSTVKKDEVGNGYLSFDDRDRDANGGGGADLFGFGLINSFTGSYGVFDRIKNREGTYEAIKLLKAPHLFFKANPLYVLGLTVPASIALVVTAVLGGNTPTTISEFQKQAIWGTFIYVYLPLYINFIPLAVFYEWNVYSRKKITNKLSDELRKLSSANDTGLTLLDSIRAVADSSSGKLAAELDIVYTKVEYGMDLKGALIEFNNKYHIPRLARTVKLITKAQEASSQITSVLSTAAQMSENQDDIDRERKSRTRMQVVIIVMTFLTLLAVMAILKTQFLDVMSGLTSQASGGSSAGGGAPSVGQGVDTAVLNVLFFHAITTQAILSGFISGYIRDADIMSGLKFVIILMTISLGVWIVVG